MSLVRVACALAILILVIFILYLFSSGESIPFRDFLSLAPPDVHTDDFLSSTPRANSPSGGRRSPRIRRTSRSQRFDQNTQENSRRSDIADYSYSNLTISRSQPNQSSGYDRPDLKSQVSFAREVDQNSPHHQFDEASLNQTPRGIIKSPKPQDEDTIDLTPTVSQIYRDQSKFNRRRTFSGRDDQNDSKGERECRRVLEKIFKKPFDKTRPFWLKNPKTKSNLELDCFNPSLKIACEYNGIQHYVYPNYTRQSRESFLYQLSRDELKKDLCQLNDILLIIVPYDVKLNKIEAYIRAELRQLARPEIVQTYLQG